MSDLLSVEGLKVNVSDKEILHGLDLKVGPGETHVIMGPNGAGKSTMGYALMGNPNYKVTEGKILFGDKDITKRIQVRERRMVSSFPSRTQLRFLVFLFQTSSVTQLMQSLKSVYVFGTLESLWKRK